MGASSDRLLNMGRWREVDCLGASGAMGAGLRQQHGLVGVGRGPLVAKSGHSVAKPRPPMAGPNPHRPQTLGNLNFGAGEEIRTLDPNLGKVVLYH